MISPTSLRPGNWIYPTGRSQYRVVTGLLLGMMEKNPDLCKEFEGIELTPELLKAAGIKESGYTTRIAGVECACFDFPADFYSVLLQDESDRNLFHLSYHYVCGESNEEESLCSVRTLDQLQNLVFFLTGSELSLPDSALIIPQVTK